MAVVRQVQSNTMLYTVIAFVALFIIAAILVEIIDIMERKKSGLLGKK